TGIPFLEAGELGGIEPRIHAGQNGEATPGRQRQLSFVAEIAGIGFVGGEHFLESFGHRRAPMSLSSPAPTTHWLRQAPFPECRRNRRDERASAWRCGGLPRQDQPAPCASLGTGCSKGPDERRART